MDQDHIDFSFIISSFNPGTNGVITSQTAWLQHRYRQYRGRKGQYLMSYFDGTNTCDHCHYLFREIIEFMDGNMVKLIRTASLKCVMCTSLYPLPIAECCVALCMAIDLSSHPLAIV